MITQTNQTIAPIEQGFNACDYLVNLIPNAVAGVNGVVEKQYDIHGAPIEPLIKINCEKELSTKRMIMNDLLTDHYDPNVYEFNCAKNNKYVKDIFIMFSNLPKLDMITQTKPFEATFDEIPVRQNDSAEIKKFLRKMNVKFLGYWCNHNAIDEKCDKVVMNTSDLLACEEFEKYKEFIDTYVYCIYQVFTYYWYDLQNNTVGRSEIPNDFHIDYSKLMKMRLCINKLNTKIYSINSQSNKRCSRCESMQKLYEYTLREVQRSSISNIASYNASYNSKNYNFII